MSRHAPHLNAVEAARMLRPADRAPRRVAHRGHSTAAPENTAPAFQAARSIGVECVELDVRESADGIPVALHDETLDRTTDAARRWGTADVDVAGRSLAELKRLDAGAWFDPRFAGTPVPTLAEALDVICASGAAVAVIERKAGDAETLLRVVDGLGLRSRVVIVSFDRVFLTECRRLAPDLVLGALGRGALHAQELDAFATLGVSVVAWRERDLTGAGVAAIHARELAAWAWTVNHKARARELVEAGIDGLVSDDPPVLDFLQGQ